MGCVEPDAQHVRCFGKIYLWLLDFLDEQPCTAADLVPRGSPLPLPLGLVQYKQVFGPVQASEAAHTVGELQCFLSVYKLATIDISVRDAAAGHFRACCCTMPDVAIVVVSLLCTVARSYCS